MLLLLKPQQYWHARVLRITTSPTVNMEQREKFFKDSLLRLKVNSICLESLKHQCEQELQLYKKEFPDGVCVKEDRSTGESLRSDSYTLALSILLTHLAWEITLQLGVLGMETVYSGTPSSVYIAASIIDSHPQ